MAAELQTCKAQMGRFLASGAWESFSLIFRLCQSLWRLLEPSVPSEWCCCDTPSTMCGRMPVLQRWKHAGRRYPRIMYRMPYTSILQVHGLCSTNEPADLPTALSDTNKSEGILRKWSCLAAVSCTLGAGWDRGLGGTGHQGVRGDSSRVRLLGGGLGGSDILTVTKTLSVWWWPLQRRRKWGFGRGFTSVAELWDQIAIKRFGEEGGGKPQHKQPNDRSRDHGSFNHRWGSGSFLDCDRMCARRLPGPFCVAGADESGRPKKAELRIAQWLKQENALHEGASYGRAVRYAYSCRGSAIHHGDRARFAVHLLLLLLHATAFSTGSSQSASNL